MQRIKIDDPSTWEDKDLNTMKMTELYEAFGLDEQTIDFLGHAVALHITDEYLQ